MSPNYALQQREHTKIADVIDWPESTAPCELDVLEALECATQLGCTWVLFHVHGLAWSVCVECGRPTQNARNQYTAWDGELISGQTAKCRDCDQITQFGIVRLHLRAMESDVGDVTSRSSQLALVNSPAHVNMLRHLRDVTPITSDLSPEALHHVFETCERLGQRYMELASALRGIAGTGERARFFAQVETVRREHHAYDIAPIPPIPHTDLNQLCFQTYVRNLRHAGGSMTAQCERPIGHAGPHGPRIDPRVPMFDVHVDPSRPECRGRAIDGTTGRCPGCGAVPERHHVQSWPVGDVRPQSLASGARCHDVIVFVHEGREHTSRCTLNVGHVGQHVTLDQSLATARLDR